MSTSTITVSPASPAIRKTATSIGYYASFIGLGLFAALLGPTLPTLAAQTGTPLSTASFIFTAKAFGYLGGSLFAGWIFDRQKGHPLVMGATLLVALLLISVPLVSFFPLLLSIIFVVGMAASAMDVGVNTLIVWVHRPNVGPAMNALHFFFGVGAFVSPLIVGQMMLISDGINWAYWSVALVLIPIALWIGSLPSPTAASTTADTPLVQIDYLLTGLTVLLFFTFVGVEVGFSGWIYTYAIEQTGFTPAQAAYLNSGFWGAFTLGRLIAIPFSARFRPRHLLLGEILLGLVSVGLILLWPSSGTVLWIGVCGTGLAIASMFPITLTWAGRNMPINGRITSWFFIGASVGAMFFPWLIGQFFEKSGPLVTMVTIFGCLMLNLVIFVALMFYAERRSSE